MSLNERYNTLSAEMIKGMGDEEDKKRKIYEKLWKENVFWSDFGKKDDNSKNNNNVNIKKTIHRGKPSNNSFSFCSEYEYNGKDEDEDILLGQLSSKLKEKKLTENERAAIKEELRIIHNLKCQTLIDAFHIKEENQGNFKVKFKQAVSGSGQELNKITRLHSSSLCCLLFFYNIKNNPLKLTFRTPKGEMTVKFTNSVFEFKSPVFNQPSNIDVVLLGKIIENDKQTDADRDVLLFLESKFAEYYLDAKKSLYISKQYFEETDVFNVLIKEGVTKKLDIQIFEENGKRVQYKKIDKKYVKTDDNDGKYYKLTSLSKEAFYIDGIKQMVSHYCGIKNIIRGRCFGYKNEAPDEEKFELNKKIKTKHPIIVLGEILFDKGIGDFPLDSEKKYLDSYRDKYKILAAALSKQIKEDEPFYILSESLVYSWLNKVVKGIDPKIKKFYGMNQSVTDDDSKPIKLSVI